MVGVKGENRVTIGAGQRMVEVPGLSGRSVEASETRYAEAGRELVDVPPVPPAGDAAVVEDVGLVRVVDRQGES